MTDMPENIKEFFRKKGREGAKKSNATRTPEQRKRQARKAAKARWGKPKGKKK